MFAEFNWWLLIVGLVVGAGLTWLVLADARRREVDLEESDLADEATWLERVMTERGEPIDAVTAEHVLRLHRAYLGLPPAEPPEPAEPPAADPWSALEATTPAPRPPVDRAVDEPSNPPAHDPLHAQAGSRDSRPVATPSARVAPGDAPADRRASLRD